MSPVERRATRRTELLNGRDYRALRRVADIDNQTLADVGDTCEQIPATALPALLASGKIERAEERRAAPKTWRGSR